MFDFKVEFPRLKAPIALIIDDPAPYVNHLYYLRKYLNPKYPAYYEELKTIPNDFLEDFISLIKKWPVKGKFSVIPNPAGQGYLDKGLKNYPKEGVGQWIKRVKEEVAPLFDITPEMITHTNAIDLETGELLPIHEQTWASQQTAKTLTPYIARALETLKNIGFETNGVTSPGAFGIDVENEYAIAVLNAVEKVYGNKFAWYFLRVDPCSHVVFPRLVYLDKYGGRGVVSIVSGNDDMIWNTMTPESRKSWNGKKLREYANYYVTDDGKAGRLVELLNAGSYIIFHTHWNSLWSNDARHGLAVMKEVLKRINTLMKDKVLWMKLSEIARYYVASKTLDIHVDKSPRRLKIFIDNKFPCADLTVSFNCDFKVNQVYLAKGRFRSGWKEAKVSETIMKLEESPDGLHSNTWFQRERRLFICFDNNLGNTIEMERA